jgi:hypothetical protein
MLFHVCGRAVESFLYCEGAGSGFGKRKMKNSRYCITKHEKRSTRDLVFTFISV